MSNDLEVGSLRLGALFDGNVDTPDVTAALSRTPDQLRLQIAWSDRESPYAGWFMQTPGRVPEEARMTCPTPLEFRDSRGLVKLLNCWSASYRANVFGPGEGLVRARYAVLGGLPHTNFEEVHGLQTVVSGLRSWFGISSWSESYAMDNTLTYESRLGPDVVVLDADGVRLSLAPARALDHDEDPDVRIARNLLYVRTRSEEPRPFAAHLKTPQALRDLLVLSRWHDETLSVTHALRDDDGAPTGDGTKIRHLWRAVVEDQPRTPSFPKGHRPHLIRRADLGPAGLIRWFSMRDEFSRALDPVVTSIGITDSTALTLLAHTGPGLEALGYLLLLRDGWSKSNARNASLTLRLERIVVDLGDSLPFDGPEWVARTASAYNGLKHANRKAPEDIVSLNAWRECVLVVRAWVARELGVPKEDLKARLADDPLSRPWIVVSG